MINHQTSLKVIDSDGGHQAMCEIIHPMHNGTTTDDNDQLIVADYITQIAFRLNGVLHAEILLGKYVAANPVLGTWFSSLRRGDEISVQWQDMAGSGGQTSLVI